MRERETAVSETELNLTLLTVAPCFCGSLSINIYFFSHWSTAGLKYNTPLNSIFKNDNFAVINVFIEILEGITLRYSAIQTVKSFKMNTNDQTFNHHMLFRMGCLFQVMYGALVACLVIRSVYIVTW